jgi:cell division initiation protein
MLTPIEIQSKSFKSGIGYDRKDVDGFMREILSSYEKLYKENVELKDKISVLNDGIQYYKTIEKTLQKALVLAEQTAEETKQAALKNAQAIEKEAHGKANLIIADAKNELNHINQMITGLTQQYESYKVQYKQLAAAQIELLQSPTFELTLMNGEKLKTSYTNPIDENSEYSNNDLNTKDSNTIDSSTNELNINELNTNDLNTNELNSNESNNTDSNIDDSDFTMVEEAATTLEEASETIVDLTSDTNNSEVKNDNSLESEFEFIDFEVNLD